MFKKFKRIFNKEDFDYSNGYINPSEFHSVAYFVTKYYGVLDECVPRSSRYILAFMLICALPALTFAVLSTFNGCRDLNVPNIIEGGAYIIVISYKLVILLCTQQNVPEFHAFMQTLREDFKYACSEESKYRQRFFENQLQTWKFCIFVAIAMSTIASGMVVAAILSLVYYLLTHDAQSQGQRPLLFPFWFFETDFGATPTYEIAFVFANVCVLAYCYNYIFMIVIQILWIREIATKADFVIWGIQDLMEGIYPATNKWEAGTFSAIIKYRMRTIIQQHHSMYELTENYSRVYKKLLMFEQTFCGPVACLTAYSAAETLDEGEVNYVLILLCVASIIVAYVPSYLCTFIRMKVSSVVDACWGTPFWNAGPVIRPYLVLIIQRSLRPLPLSFGGFQEVSVQTFSNKMASAYSCFNMLRQAF